MRRWLLVVVVMMGCKTPAKTPIAPEFPSQPNKPVPEPTWSNNDAPEPNWSSNSPTNPMQTGDVLRISPPPRPFEGNVQLQVPEGVAPGQELPVRVNWQADQPTVARLSIPDGVQLLRSDPPARIAGRHLEWNVPAGSGAMMVLFQPARVGRVEFDSDIGDGGAPAKQSRAVSVIGVTQLRMQATGPKTASLGDTTSFEARVTNAGQVPSTRGSLHVDLDAGLEHATGSRRVDLPIGTLAPGESKNLIVPVAIKRSGSLAATLSVLGESGSAVAESLHIEIREARLAVSLEGPASLMVNQSGTWKIRVVNTGDAPATNISARVQMPPELTTERQVKVAWPIGTLRPHEDVILPVIATAIAPVSRTSVIASAMADRIPEVRSDATLECIGAPMLKLTLRGNESITEVGKSVVYTVEVKNTGTLPLKNVDIIADLPNNLTPKHGVGPTMATMASSRITFGRLAEILPNKSVVYRFETEATQSGDARVSVEARSDSIPAPVRQDEATRIVSR